MIPAARDRMQPVSRNCLLHAFVAVLSLALGGAATAQSDPALTIAESGDNYRLSVPVSRLVMTIPKGAFTVANVSAGGATASPRYFLLKDAVRGVSVSGWFESSGGYAGFDAFWKNEANALRRNGLSAANVERTRVDKWEAVLYEQQIPKGTNANIRAEWIEEGTWIDVHISVTTKDPSSVARAAALNVLKEITVAVLR
jgi:hypothetical protein